MAIYSASVKPVSRAGGRSATAAAAYRNAEKIVDERTGEVHDYTRRRGVEFAESFAPAGMVPAPAAELWNRAEAAETRKNARVAREVLVALPHELTPEQRRELAREIAQALADRYGTAGTLAVHQPDREGDQRNHHAHILMTTRRLEPSGELGEKTRELDDVQRGPQEVEWVRAMVEARTNHALECAGLEARVDRRTLEQQRIAALAAGDQERAAGLDRRPTLHEGPRVTQIRREAARQGRKPLGALDRAAANDERRQLAADQAALRQVAQVIDFAEAKAAREQAPRGLEGLIQQMRAQVGEEALAKAKALRQQDAARRAAAAEPAKPVLSPRELRAEAARRRPGPLDEAVKSAPEVVRATEHARELAAIGSTAWKRREQAAKEIEQWRKDHPIQAKAHDAGWKRAAFLVERQQRIEAAERTHRETWPQYEAAQIERERIMAAARARIGQEQAEVLEQSARAREQELAEQQRQAWRGLGRDGLEGLDQGDYGRLERDEPDLEM